MADWNNETDSIVIGKCVNANSEQPSGVNRTKQGNNGREWQPVQQPSELDWGEGEVKAVPKIIAMRAL